MIQETGGVADLVIDELSRRARLPIGSIYQYFSGKTGIIRGLAELHLWELRRLLRKKLYKYRRRMDESDHVFRATDDIIDAYYEFYRTDPTYRYVWAGAWSDPGLRELDINDTRQNAKLLSLVFAPYFPDLEAARFRGLCLLLCENTASGLRLALELEAEEARALVAELKAMFRNHLAAHLDGAGAGKK